MTILFHFTNGFSNGGRRLSLCLCVLEMFRFHFNPLTQEACGKSCNLCSPYDTLRAQCVFDNSLIGSWAIRNSVANIVSRVTISSKELEIARSMTEENEQVMHQYCNGRCKLRSNENF